MRWSLLLGGRIDIHAEDRTDVDTMTRAEWRRHIAPDHGAAAVRAAHLEVTRATGMTRQSAHARWRHVQVNRQAREFVRREQPASRLGA